MLVLSRKQNERIVVGGSVVVTVVRISGDKVRLGIDAPADVRVIRDEVADRDSAADPDVATDRNQGIIETIAGGSAPVTLVASWPDRAAG